MTRLRGVVAASVLAALLGSAFAAAPVSAAPSNPLTPNRTAPDGRCVVAKDDAQETVDALQHRCTSRQILDLFASAKVGDVPTGRKAIALLPAFQLGGRLLPYGVARTMTTAQSTLGDSLTFTTGPGGRPWVYKNYIWGRDAGGPLTPGLSRLDHKPVWTADFSRDFAGVPISIHEYRQLTPGVWIGRDIGGGSSTSSRPTGGAIAVS
ncbi:hypothetical protein [Gordonia sp. SL306]|uniref:hypothetical protein n=1 Tax=Gordonia sp. SL306 TaxID=2995145 RepID=UPI00226F0FC9|nr:hypothetical protein [Gordonia sp. SL306]WAC55695.1 hypothetical protein OVA31_24555 [Gordonia sp. SL306]